MSKDKKQTQPDDQNDFLFDMILDDQIDVTGQTSEELFASARMYHLSALGSRTNEEAIENERTADFYRQKAFEAEKREAEEKKKSNKKSKKEGSR